jgi:hypothetical protein
VAEYRRVLPMLADGAVPAGQMLRRYQRHSLRCPAELRIQDPQGGERRFVVTVVELSLGGFQARSSLPLPVGGDGLAHIELGAQEQSHVQVQVVRQVASDSGLFFGLRLREPDGPWQRCVAAMESHDTGSELNRV